MKKSQNVEIGKVLDAHGIKGDVYCFVFSGDVSWIRKVKALTLKSTGAETEFEILRIKPFKKGFIVSLKGFDNRNKAEEFKGSTVWVSASAFVSNDGEALYLKEILNFHLTDENSGPVGTISSFASNGIQDLLVVEKGGKNFEIPFVEAFIIKIDFEAQTILCRLPEGLLEINDPKGGSDED